MQDTAFDWPDPFKVLNASAGPISGRRGWWWTAVKAALVLAGVAYAIGSAAHPAAVQCLHLLSVPLALLALLPALLIPVLGGLRWWIVLRGGGLRPGKAGDLAMLFSVSGVVGQILPSIASDGLRGLLAIRRGYRPNDVLHSIVLERAMMVLALLVLLVATEPLLTERIGRPSTVWLSPMLLGTGVGSFVALLLADRFGLGCWLTPPWVQALAVTARRLTLSRWGVAGFAISLASNLNFVVAAALLSRTLGLPITLPDCLAVIPLATLATALPISLGGWGVREGTLVVLFGTMGVPLGGALLLSLSYGLYSALSGLPGFAAWCLTPNKHRQPLPLGEVDAERRVRVVPQTPASKSAAPPSPGALTRPDLFRRER
jgi:glycosyltransferase 2 family protein